MDQAHRLMRLTLLDLTGEHDPGGLGMAHAHQLEQRQPINSRHLRVTDNDVGSGRFEVIERLLAIASEQHLPIGMRRAHGPANSSQDQLGVLNKKNVFPSSPIRLQPFKRSVS